MNVLPHEEVKSEDENPWEGDRGGGGQKFLQFCRFQWRRIERQIIRALLL